MKVWLIALIVIGTAFVFWKNLNTPKRVGDGPAPCPWTPNCVSSEAKELPYAIAPLPPVTLGTIESYLLTHYDAVVITKRSDYLHVVVTTPTLRFKDDLEFFVRPEGVAVRSASRVGYSDGGVNRKRIEAMRKDLEGK